MKRIGAIVSLSIMIVLFTSSISFASGLTLESTFPEEGGNGLQPTNVAVKLVFSENITSEQAQEANKDCFKITDTDGNIIEFNALYNSDKYPNQIWLQIKGNLVDDMGYELMISEDLQSSSGNTLDQAVTLDFSTRDTSSDSSGYMVLMVLMVVGMIIFTAWDAKRKLKKESGEETEKKINPYKEAKRTGKPVEEIIAKIEKEKAQAEKRKAKEAKRQIEKDKDDERDGVKKVRARRPISDVGVATPENIIAQRKAREEAKAKEAKKAREKEKSQQVKRSKGSKQKQKKKK